MTKLTETFAKKLDYTDTGTAKYWDAEIKGLVLFVGKRSKTWYFQKDVGGVTRRVLIGRYPIISAPAARQAALELVLAWSRGAGRTMQLGAPTLSDAVDAYLARPKLRSEDHKQLVRNQIGLHLRDWMRRPLDEITKAEVVARHAELGDRPSSANHTLKYFRTVYNHARRVHELPECPTVAIEWYPEPPNGSLIDDLQDWSDALTNLQNPIHRSFYELLLFTGFRKTEALTLEWQNVHDDRIHLPMTKNGRSFDLPITPRHLKILAPMRRLNSRWVFPAPRGPEGRLASPEKINWTPHAHRRTFATIAVEAGVLEEIVGRLLNHTPLSVTGQRYTRPSLEALRPSMVAICDEVDRRLALG